MARKFGMGLFWGEILSRDFFCCCFFLGGGGCLKPKGFFWVLIFAPI